MTLAHSWTIRYLQYSPIHNWQYYESLLVWLLEGYLVYLCTPQMYLPREHDRLEGFSKHDVGKRIIVNCHQSRGSVGISEVALLVY